MTAARERAKTREVCNSSNNVGPRAPVTKTQERLFVFLCASGGTVAEWIFFFFRRRCLTHCWVLSVLCPFCARLPALAVYGMDTDEEETKTMQAIDLPEQALELSFHPNRDVIASGLVNGKVCL